MDNAQLPPQAQQLLQKMHDIYAPPEVSWWPLAPGWWVVIIMTCVIASAGVYWLIQKLKRNRYRKEALKLLTNDNLSQSVQGVSEINGVLKRTALYAYPNERAQIARLFGDAWVQWLNDHCKKPVIDAGAGSALAQGGYAPREVNVNALREAAKRWVKQHGVAANSRVLKLDRRPHV